MNQLIMKQWLYFSLLFFLPLGANAQNTVESRFSPPAGFVRKPTDTTTFIHYLRHLPLHPKGTSVHYYNGLPKPNNNIYAAVVKMDIGKKDLQQCADAVMRLRGEYLYHRKEYEKIHFNLLHNGKPSYFSTYAKGDYSYANFRKYMEFIFDGANTASLFHELKPVMDLTQMKPGDVFVEKKQPYGHAVIVVDMARNPQTGEKVFMLAQSYMPAQETQILLCPETGTVWYPLGHSEIVTPEWTFSSSHLKRFGNE